MLPMVAMEGACLRRVMLSFMRPSPVTFTVNGLPVGAARWVRLPALIAPVCFSQPSPAQYSPTSHQARACRQT